MITCCENVKFDPDKELRVAVNTILLLTSLYSPEYELI
jgi:hypothetical protein